MSLKEQIKIIYQLLIYFLFSFTFSFLLLFLSILFPSYFPSIFSGTKYSINFYLQEISFNTGHFVNSFTAPLLASLSSADRPCSLSFTSHNPIWLRASALLVDTYLTTSLFHAFKSWFKAFRLLSRMWLQNI